MAWPPFSWAEFFMGLLLGAIVIAGFEWSHHKAEQAMRIRVARIRAAWMAAQREGA